MWYTIKPGDSLSILAGKYLGSIMLFNQIYEQNKDVIADPNVIVPGQRIWIPVDGKQRPDLMTSQPFTEPKKTAYTDQSPYQSTFPSSGSETVVKAGPSLPSNLLSNVNTNDLFLYGGIGLVGLALILSLS